MHADALAFQNRERLAAEIEDDVAHVVVGARSGQPVVALHRRLGRLAERIEIDRRLGRRPRRARPAAGAAMRVGEEARYLGVERLARAVVRRGSSKTCWAGISLQPYCCSSE